MFSFISDSNPIRKTFRTTRLTQLIVGILGGAMIGGLFGFAYGSLETLLLIEHRMLDASAYFAVCGGLTGGVLVAFHPWMELKPHANDHRTLSPIAPPPTTLRTSHRFHARFAHVDRPTRHSSSVE